jgi:hypothetical protein
MSPAYADSEMEDHHAYLREEVRPCAVKVYVDGRLLRELGRGSNERRDR